MNFDGLNLNSPPTVVNITTSKKNDNEIRSVNEFIKICSIGEGSYGIVYKAKDKVSGSIVALKKVKMEKVKDGMPITSLREILLLESIKHPNIVNLNEVVVGSSIDSIYLVFEYLEHDLASLIDSKAPGLLFKENEIKSILIQLLKSIEYLHFHWIIHRDLKCSNLLYSNHGILKLADFGLARKYGRAVGFEPLTPKVVTLWYRSPELLLGEDCYDGAIDIWAIGCIFGELLLGKPLLSGTNELDQLNKIFKLLGSPNDKIWPQYHKLPLSSRYSFPQQPFNNLNQVFPKLSSAGLDLLNHFLTLDPLKRITATEALKHPYFFESPFPQSISLMPSFPTIQKNLNKK